MQEGILVHICHTVFYKQGFAVFRLLMSLSMIIGLRWTYLPQASALDTTKAQAMPTALSIVQERAKKKTHFTQW